MGEETVEKILKDFGLTEKEIEIYIFLAKHGVLKSREVARQIKKDKAQVLRILKSLENKCLAESTLEAPKRFTAVPFEKVLDAFVKAKRDEATLVERTKKDLLLHWRSFGETGPEAQLEKFVVIEGSEKIYSKISKMVTETKNQLSTISTVPGLLRADQMGLFDLVVSHPLRSKIQLRFLTELAGQNSNAINALLEKALKAGVDFRGRNPDLGVKPSPRMVIRDGEEVFLFITPREENPRAAQVDTGIWTNCRTLVQTFASVFEDLWRNATDTQPKSVDVDTGDALPKTFIVPSAKMVHKMYHKILNSAKEEIMFMTSSQGLLDFWKIMPLLKNWTSKGVAIKIMAPIAVENLQAVQQLSKYCEVRHFPESLVKTTIVDGKHLFQCKNPILYQDMPDEERETARIRYTSDSDYVAKTKAVLYNIWKSAQAPSVVTLESLLNPPASTLDPFRRAKVDIPYFKSVMRIEEHERGTITEKDVLNKILNAKRIVAKDPLKDISCSYGSSAIAVIHPPEHFHLPNMTIWAWRCDKHSSWGAEDWLTVSLWLDTRVGFRYVPVAHVTDNPDAFVFRKGVYAGTPAGQNCQLVNKDRFQVQVHGNSLFAGWTMPIPLFPPPYVLPPSCILFEGYGELRTAVTRTRIPSGRTQITEANQFNAFVTFFHPASKYSGPGTDGRFNRDVYFTAYPPT